MRSYPPLNDLYRKDNSDLSHLWLHGYFKNSQKVPTFNKAFYYINTIQ